MEIKLKKELLRYNLLTCGYQEDLSAYLLLQNSSLDIYISKINEQSLYFNSNISNNELNATQFIRLLQFFAKTFKELFFNIIASEHIINMIITSNSNLVAKYFNITNNDISDPFFKECIYKMIISNFIANANYNPLIKDFLDENNIEIKEVDDYNYIECEKIAFLMSDLVFCQRGRGKIYGLFENIKSQVAILKQRKKEREEYNIDKHITKLMSYHISQCQALFKTYNNKKKYLKLFQ